jgi:hypothetical protein
LRRVLYTITLLLALLATAPVIAQSKKPWTLTLEERIALRTSPKLAQERVGDDRQVQASSVRSPNSKSGPIADAFDGKTHPELFLPHEVFDELIKLAFSGPPRTSQIVQDGFLPEVKRHGLPLDFWERLRLLSTVYIADRGELTDIGVGVRKQAGRGRERAEAALVVKHEDLCRSRADALDAARSKFGRERFDRFLYEVIAVNMFYVADRLPYAERLQKAEEGCR